MSARTSPKAEALLDAARKLFLRHGIRRVTVQEICATASVSKVTFYKYFANKEDVAIRVLDQVIGENRARAEDLLARDIPIEEKVTRLIAFKSALSGKTTAEFYAELVSQDSEPGRFAAAKRREWDARVRRFYAEAQQAGEIRSDIDIDFLMYMIERIRLLIADPELRAIYPDFSQLTRALMDLFYYGVIPRLAANEQLERPREGSKT